LNLLSAAQITATTDPQSFSNKPQSRIIMTANTKATNNTKAAQPIAEPIADAFDPLALLALAMAELEPAAASSRASKGTGSAAVPIAPIGLPEHLAALESANLQPISGAAGHVTRYGGTIKGTNPNPRPVKRRTGVQTAAYGLLGMVKAGQSVPIGHVYRTALALTGQTPSKPVEPEQILQAMAAQAGQAVTVSHDGAVELSTLARGAKGESRLIAV
jgi:hypothetical protein